MSGKKPLGLYIHVPFCAGKCPYCDFYSLPGDEAGMDRYVKALARAFAPYAGVQADTVYFGGGTPSLLGAARLGALLERVRAVFRVQPGAEITLEANPAGVDGAFFAAVRKAGFTRLSLGMQSADEATLRLLGRRHTPRDVENAVAAARAAGFGEISLDLMLGLPGERLETLLDSAAFAVSLAPEHISAYLLKVEPGTVFYAKGVSPLDPDMAADHALALGKFLREAGYAQYEISNFARPGHEGRHNLHYWRDEEYLGFGPAAHSFFEGRRFFYPRDLEGFLRAPKVCPDGTGGDFEEFALLNLRLARGLCRSDCRERFGPAGEEAFEALCQRAKTCPPALYRMDGDSLSFTPEGFLVSNALLTRLLSPR